MTRRCGILWCTILVSLVLAGTPVHAQRSISVMIGYRSEKPNERPRRLELGSNNYNVDVAIAPPDRDLIRSAEVFYIDDIPEGMEFFRDDMEAFHYMIHSGGLVVLVADSASSAHVIENLNYLGTRFDFSYSERAVSGAFTPEEPRRGPIGGNVWRADTSMHPLQLRSPEWRVWHRAAESGDPVVASKRIGKGLLLVLGTREIDRQEGQRQQNALTLIEWGLREMQSPSPPALVPAEPVQVSDGSGSPKAVTREERERVLLNSETHLLSRRIEELRRVYGISTPVETEGLLIPVDDRKYFPYRANLSDAAGNLFQASTHNGPPMLMISWASWDPESRRFLEENRELFRQIYVQGVTMVGLSLDRDGESAQTLADDLGFFDILICDETGWRTPFAEDFLIDRIPRLILADGQGRISAADLHVADLQRALIEIRGQ